MISIEELKLRRVWTKPREFFILKLVLQEAIRAFCDLFSEELITWDSRNKRAELILDVVFTLMEHDPYVFICFILSHSGAQDLDCQCWILSCNIVRICVIVVWKRHFFLKTLQDWIHNKSMQGQSWVRQKGQNNDEWEASSAESAKFSFSFVWKTHRPRK